MRRLPILLAFALVFALFVIAAASAAPSEKFCDRFPDHQKCSTQSTTTTAPPSVEACVFEDGVLTSWNQSGPYRCQWVVEDRSTPFKFELQAATPDAKTVRMPHLIVDEAYLYGDECFNEVEVSWHSLPYAFTPFMLPSDGECFVGSFGDDTDSADVYALVIAARSRTGEIQLRLLP